MNNDKTIKTKDKTVKNKILLIDDDRYPQAVCN